MKKISLSLFILTLGVGLSGCSSWSSYPVTYNSTPQSAMLVCNGQQKGYTPVTLNYQRSGIDSSGDLFTEQCKAVWSSGAEQYYPLHYDTNQYPDGVMSTIPRPNVDGYSADASMDYQKKVNDQNAQYQQQQSLNNSIQQMQNSMPKHTYCNQIGWQTVCNTY